MLPANREPWRDNARDACDHHAGYRTAAKGMRVGERTFAPKIDPFNHAFRPTSSIGDSLVVGQLEDHRRGLVSKLLRADNSRMFSRRRVEAGRYAEDRYRQGLRRWRAGTRLVAIGILGPLLVLGVAGLIAFGQEISWLAGALAGAAIAGWTMLRDTPPRYVEQWRDGAEGERKTERALRPLERSGLHVVHDVPSRYGNYDHIAVGIGGVFLIESKNLQGTVELRDGVPHLLRRLDPEAKLRFERIRPTALGAAARLKEEIERESGVRIWVQAVVVFWSPFRQGLVDDGRCVFVHGTRLQEWLAGRPTRLPPGTVKRIADALDQVAERGPGQPATSAPKLTPI